MSIQGEPVSKRSAGYGFGGRQSTIYWHEAVAPRSHVEADYVASRRRPGEDGEVRRSPLVDVGVSAGTLALIDWLYARDIHRLRDDLARWPLVRDKVEEVVALAWNGLDLYRKRCWLDDFLRQAHGEPDSDDFLWWRERLSLRRSFFGTSQGAPWAEFMAYAVPDALSVLEPGQRVELADSYAACVGWNNILEAQVPTFHMIVAGRLQIERESLNITRGHRSLLVWPTSTFHARATGGAPNDQCATHAVYARSDRIANGVVWHRHRYWTFYNMHFHPGEYVGPTGKIDGILEYPIYSNRDEEQRLKGTANDPNKAAVGELHLIFSTGEGEFERFMTIGGPLHIGAENEAFALLLSAFPSRPAAVGEMFPYLGRPFDLWEIFGASIDRAVAAGTLLYNAWGSPNLAGNPKFHAGSHTHYVFPVEVSRGQFNQLRQIIPSLVELTMEWAVAPVPRTPLAPYESRRR